MATCEHLQMTKNWMNALAKKTAKMEKRLKVKLGGYQVSRRFL